MKKAIKVGAVVLLALIVILAVALPRVLDPNKYKDTLVAAVKKSTGRDLKIGGAIDWSLRPLGLQFSGLELSNAQGFGEEPLAKIGKAEFQAQLMPLLHGEVVIDKVHLEGLALNLAKDASGKTNWSDLVSSEPAAKEEPSAGGESPITALKIGSVEIREAAITWKDLAADQRYTLEHLDLSTGSISKNQPVDLKLGVDLEYGQPAKKSRLEVASQFVAEATGFTLSSLDLKLDDTHLTGNMKLTSVPKPEWSFDFNADQFNLDRYVSAASGKEIEAPAETKESPLTILRGLTGSGKLKVGQLQAFGAKLSAIALQFEAKDGVLSIGPNSATLYQGSYQGNDVISVAGNVPTLKFDEQLKAVQFEPLLKDLCGFDRYSGIGAGKIAISGEGGSKAAFKKSLAGSMSFALQNGRIKGFDLEKIIQQTKAASQQIQGKTVTAKTTPGDETLFQGLSASFRLNNGTAATSDILLEGKSIRATGTGSASLVSESLDFRLNVTLVGGDNGKDLTVPVAVTGTFGKPDFGVDWGKAAKQAAKKGIETGLKKLIKKKN